MARKARNKGKTWIGAGPARERTAPAPRLEQPARQPVGTHKRRVDSKDSTDYYVRTTYSDGSFADRRFTQNHRYIDYTPYSRSGNLIYA